VIRRIGSFLLVVTSAWAQSSFRATTKLVQVSVIAQDANGKPVMDLRREVSYAHLLGHGI